MTLQTCPIILRCLFFNLCLHIYDTKDVPDTTTMHFFHISKVPDTTTMHFLLRRCILSYFKSARYYDDAFFHISKVPDTTTMHSFIFQKCPILRRCISFIPACVSIGCLSQVPHLLQPPPGKAVPVVSRVETTGLCLGLADGEGRTRAKPTEGRWDDIGNRLRWTSHGMKMSISGISIGNLS